MRVPWTRQVVPTLWTRQLEIGAILCQMRVSNGPREGKRLTDQVADATAQKWAMLQELLGDPDVVALVNAKRAGKVSF